MASKITFSCLILCCLAAINAQNPGFQIALTNKGLEYARSVIEADLFIHLR